jgi:tungstate transport system substrate-binding protein
MIRRLATLILLPTVLPAAILVAQSRDIVLATTTSTQDSGLLDSLVPAFERQAGIEVKVIAVGTGAALEMARRGNADVVLVHAPEAERPYVESGDLTAGRLVMHNDFLLVGPPGDPAHVRGAGRPAEAMRRVARAGLFIGRGDGSGTEKKEVALWREAGIDPDTLRRREETGQGMGATLLVAEERRGYTLTDRATYLALRERLTLMPLVEGAPSLLNVYHAYLVDPGRHPRTRAPEGRAFVAFLVAPATQRLIGDFGRARFGQPLFYPDAGKAEPTRERSGAGTH